MRSGLGIVGLAAVLLGGCSQGERRFEAGPLVDETAVLAKSDAVAEQFQGALQAQLKAALEEGGPMQAVAVCHDAAPAIAKAESERSGAEVSRVAAKNRNPTGALSDEIAPHYAQLEKAPIEGGKPASVVWNSGTGEAAQVNVLRAIPMQEKPCTVCHGTSVDPALQARIKALYPGDAATGFKPGDMRGAMLIRWPASAFTPQAAD